MLKDSEIGNIAAIGPAGHPPCSKYERLDLLGALDVGHRAVDRGAVDWRVMPDGDRVVALKRLERLENDNPVIEMIRTGEGVLVR